MRTTRSLLAAPAALVGIAISCGGRLDGVPSVMDHDTSRQPRGSGTACIDFDTKKLFDRPTCDAKQVDGCSAWRDQALHGFPYVCPAICYDDGRCGWNVYTCVNGALVCPLGESGDAACQAIAQEYVKGNGAAIATCKPACKEPGGTAGLNNGPCGSPSDKVGGCAFDMCGPSMFPTPPSGGSNEENPPTFCVRRNGVVKLEYPCQEP